MNRQEKEIELGRLTERVQKAKALLFAGFRGLNVSQIDLLRSNLRKESAQMRVIKNRIAKKALDAESQGELTQYLDGPTALASTEGDTAALAKVLVNFAKENEALELRGGSLEGKVISLAQLKVLAQLPSREELLAKAFASMNAPATNFVGVLAALPRQLVTVINALKEKKA